MKSGDYTTSQTFLPPEYVAVNPDCSAPVAVTVPYGSGATVICENTKLRNFATGGGQVLLAGGKWSINGSVGDYVNQGLQQQEEAEVGGQFQITYHDVDGEHPCHYTALTFDLLETNVAYFTATGECGVIAVTIRDNGSGNKASPDSIMVIGASHPDDGSVVISTTGDENGDGVATKGNWTVHLGKAPTGKNK